MAEGAEDKEQKTEEPTRKRLEEAQKKGQVPFSRELPSFLMLFVFALFLTWYMPGAMRRTREFLTPFFSDANNYEVDNAAIGQIMLYLLSKSAAILVVPLLAAAVAAMAGSLIQNGFRLSGEPLKPTLEKISVFKGIERLFSLKTLIEFLKGLVKITLIGFIAYFAVQSDIGHLKQVVDDDALALLIFLSKLIGKLMIWVCVVMFFIAGADWIYQRFDYIKGLRMSKQELKDEYKQQEGDPLIKAKLRQIRMERAKNRMMADVPKADVVITNPTHYAVALKYENDTMQAPLVVAKGADLIALTIRRIASENDVIIVENPPLARALFDACDIGDEVPITQYKAVAEVISYVYKMKGKLPKR